MAGNLPPGCTQRECDMAQPGYWDEPPEDERDIDVPCEVCGTEGRIYRGQYENERDCGECPACQGKGGVQVPTKPITADDLDEAWPEFSDEVPF